MDMYINIEKINRIFQNCISRAENGVCFILHRISYFAIFINIITITFYLLFEFISFAPTFSIVTFLV